MIAAYFKRTPRLWLPFWSFWAIIALIFAVRKHVYVAPLPEMAGAPVQRFLLLLFEGLVRYFGSGIEAILAFLIAWRFPLRTRAHWRNLIYVIILGAAVYVAKDLYTGWLRAWVPTTNETPRGDMFRRYTIYITNFIYLIATGYALEYFVSFRQQERENRNLEAGIAASQLSALAARLDLNSLRTRFAEIDQLIEKDGDEANARLTTLAEELRARLHDAGPSRS